MLPHHQQMKVDQDTLFRPHCSPPPFPGFLPCRPPHRLPSAHISESDSGHLTLIALEASLAPLFLRLLDLTAMLHMLSLHPSELGT
ncbi:hypothetical protein IQ07DRAFT_187421 [Pyrenochaeta sp. DS3sAY3a]|nr:hypothetical protein IQ07DRAFT_187421 [Pyrenochaeta sp. DS3sAY3a]